MSGDSRFGWRVLLIAAAGEELTDDERVEFKRLTGRAGEPRKMVRELVAIFGRRVGKTGAPSVETGNETLERARTLFGEMQREYASGNFARYGELLQQLGKLLLRQ
jgi:hypothetical protein